MPVPAEPVLFEALCTPPPSLGATGLRVVVGAVATCSAVIGLGCVWFGAWPVLGFVGAEVLLVLGLLMLHRRRATRHPEIVRLVGDKLLIGDATLSAYWTRVELAESGPGGPRLRLRDRGRVLEIGRDLGEAARRDLAAALHLTLLRQRTPNFRNAQLDPVSRSVPGS